MNLISFGSSLTFGQALKGCNMITPHKLAYPSLIAKQIGAKCKNFASPGASNKLVLKKILETKINPSDIVTVQWNNFTRWAIINENNVSSIGPWTDDFDKWVKYFYTDKDATFNHTIIIDYAWLHLSTIGCKFIFSRPEKNEEKFNKKNFLHAHNFVDHISDFLVDAAEDNDHPGPESHKLYAEYLMKFII